VAKVDTNTVQRASPMLFVRYCHINFNMMNAPKIFRFRSLEEAENELINLHNISPRIDTSGEWALPVTLDHCAESLEGSLHGYPQLKPQWFRYSVGPLAKHVFLWNGAMSHNTHDPIPGFEDQPSSNSDQEAFDRLFLAIANFKTWNREVAEHFAYGKLSKEEAEKLQAFHIADHLSRIIYPT
jgi:Protein of unknown function (DUF1569)